MARDQSEMRQNDVDRHDTSALEEALGHVFQQPGLLEQALTHASYAREAESQKRRGRHSAVGDGQ